MSEKAPNAHKHFFPVGSLKFPKDFRGLDKVMLGTTAEDNYDRGIISSIFIPALGFINVLTYREHDAGITYALGFLVGNIFAQLAVGKSRESREKAEEEKEEVYQRSVENRGAVLASELLPIAKDIFLNSRPIPGTNPPRRTQVLVDYMDTVLSPSVPVSKLELHIWNYYKPMRYLVGLDMYEKVPGEDNPAVTKMFFKFGEPKMVGFKFLGVESSTKPNFDILETVTMAQKAAPFVY